MASRLSALNHYRPQIEYGETADWHEVAEYIASHTGWGKADIIRVLLELQGALIYFLGKNAREIFALWDQEHPEDPLP